MICIYIRSLDQARGLLAQGALVFPSAVSSDSRHASSGTLCTACVCPWSLSALKLSCLSHFFLLISLYPLSLYHMVLSTVTDILEQKSSFCLLTSPLSIRFLLSLCHLTTQHTVYLYTEFIMSSYMSAFIVSLMLH